MDTWIKEFGIAGGFLGILVMVLRWTGNLIQPWVESSIKSNERQAEATETQSRELAAQRESQQQMVEESRKQTEALSVIVGQGKRSLEMEVVNHNLHKDPFSSFATVVSEEALSHKVEAMLAAAAECPDDLKPMFAAMQPHLLRAQEVLARNRDARREIL